MKKFKICLVLLFTLFSVGSFAQEKYGTSVNFGLGIGGYSGYYRHLGVYVPVIHLDLEFDVAKNFTLAPFINFYSYSYRYSLSNPYREYVYKVNVIPVGVKGTYYLDGLLQAGPKWDFYVGGSLGVVLVRTSWNDPYYFDNGYYTGYYGNPGPAAYLDLHLGTEYHINDRVGIFLDLSNGLSTAGIAIH
jgi:hypothetical protein